MLLSPEDIRRVANLARIETSRDEENRLLLQMSGIFDLIGQMQAVDTTGIKPMSHAQNVTQRLRDDVVTEADQRELFQSIAPQTESGLYLVPQVIE